MTTLHDTGELTCPRCGTSLDALEGRVTADTTAVDEQIRVCVCYA